jgi:O-antigen/teichoic acid export membrane protein
LLTVSVVVCLGIPAGLGLLAMNDKRNYFKIYALGTVLNILSNITLVFCFGAAGTAVAVFITEFFIMAGLTREIYRAAGKTPVLALRKNEL